MRKGPDTEKAADQAFNQGLETRCGKDCPDRILIQGAPPTYRTGLNSDIANTVLAVTRGLQ